MLRHFDRRGREIKKEKWKKLFGDPRQFYVRTTRAGNRQICTYWVGVAPYWEKVPLIFCVESKPILPAEDAPGGKVTEPAELAWVATEEDALKLHALFEAGARREAA